MGTSLILKTADFSRNGINVPEVVLDYINIAGTITEATITYGSALKGLLLYKSPGMRFNYIEIRLNDMKGDDLVINKYNSSNNSITLLHLSNYGSNVLAKITLSDTIELASNEYLMFSSNNTGTTHYAQFMEVTEPDECIAYIQNDNTMLRNYNEWKFLRPCVKLLLK